MKIKLGFRNWLLIFLVVFSLLSIFGMPPIFLQKGVVVDSVETNSTAFQSGFRSGQIISAIDGNKINSFEDYQSLILEKYSSDEKMKTIFTLSDGEVIYFSDVAPEIYLSDIPKSNIQTGLDISGGARALIQAKDKDLSSQEIQDLVSVTEQRLNVYGISDVKVAPVSDLAGNNFMLVELAGATPSDLKSLLEQQGKFEAKIKNETVFTGGNKDISSVGRNPPEAIIETCQQSQDSWFCNFRFNIYLSERAAQKHADVTKDLGVNSTAQGRYLSDPLDLYLDDVLVDSLLISEGLRGRVTTQISISGSGTGPTREDAYTAAEQNMNQLQTVLITGSLPYKVEIVKLDTISPLLGQEFTRIILIAGILALVAASLVVFARYRNIKSSLTLILISFSEIIIILGIASLIEWNLDFPSIAGILATIGTGFDDQIVILDESRHERTISLKQRLKRAFAIIFGAYFTALVSLFPLLWAGAGLLKGFAFTTIIGITTGVFVTRPAFAEIVRRIERKRD